ncbi:MAG: hypothetical protein ACREV0_10710, partial [Burkholderiales bacterium]
MARHRFRCFIEQNLGNYEKHRNQPHTDDTSHMSPYLHFGQISPLYLALEMKKAGGGEDQESFLEELIVRRELGMNYVHFTDDYDSLKPLPRWAKMTLDAHRKDRREHHYSREQLEAAETHDPYWNAAMNETKVTGYMQNYMRMYWGKNILEWSATPEEGFKATLALMNRYFLDGRDPLSYSNPAWVYGMHDRPWFERPI